MTIEELFVNQYLALLQAKDELENEIHDLREKLETSETMVRQIEQEKNNIIDGLIPCDVSESDKLTCTGYNDAYLTGRHISGLVAKIINNRINERLKEKKDNE